MSIGTEPSVRRWPWLVGSVLLLGSGGAAARATYLHWLPCRGSMLEGTFLHGYAYSDRGFSDACLRRMDEAGGPAFYFPVDPSVASPSAIRWSATALVLCGLAWLVVILAMRWSRRLRLLSGAAALPILVQAWLTLDSRRGFDMDGRFDALVVLSGEVLTASAVIVVARSVPDVRDGLWRSLTLLAWGSTTYGLFHVIFDYTTMTIFSDANWDTPPGTGYGLALVPLVAAVGIVVRATGLHPLHACARLVSRVRSIRLQRVSAAGRSGSSRYPAW